MYTHCPECGTTFRVTPDLLRRALGRVRCGVCDTVFNAVHFLSDEPAPISVVEPRRPLAPAPAPAMAAPAGLATLHAQVAAFQAAQFAGPSSVPASGEEPGALEDTGSVPLPALADGAHPPPGHTAGPAAAATPETAEALADDTHPEIDQANRAGDATPPARPAAPQPGATTAAAQPLASPAGRPGGDSITELFRTVAAAAAEVQSKSAQGIARRALTSFESARGATPDTGAATGPDEAATIEAPAPAPPPAAEPTPTPAPVAAPALPPVPAGPHPPDPPTGRSAPVPPIDGRIDGGTAGRIGARADAPAVRVATPIAAPAAESAAVPRAAGSELTRGATDAAADGPTGAVVSAPDPLPLAAAAAATPAPIAPSAEGDADEPVAAPAAAVPFAHLLDEDAERHRFEPLRVTMPEPAAAAGGYGLAAAVALLVLLGQIGHFWRESLAELPYLGPPVQRAYEALGRPIAPRWSIADYSVKQLGAASEIPGTLRLLARVQNRAARAQPYPLLRVTLLDRYETKLARREFTPAEYLPSRRKPEGLLPTDQRVDADLLLVDPGNDAVSFELDLCLYAQQRLVCAQDERGGS